MCLYINKTFKTRHEARNSMLKPLIAKEDIIVYKRLVSLFFRSNIFHSPYQLFEFEKGYEYIENKPFTKKIINDLLDNLWRVTINSGFHAYTKKSKAFYKKQYTETVVKMIIPKGAKYFLGENGHIVSNRIIFY